MQFAPWRITLGQEDSTYGILATVTLLIILLALFFLSGLLDRVFGLVSRVIEGSIRAGFEVWTHTLAWARLKHYAALVTALLVLGIHGLHVGREWVSLPISVLLLAAGVVACTAFMHVSLERAEVARGYKAVHNPAKGQELARDVIHYGDRLGAGMLAVSGAATLAGFALLNQCLYETLGESWYLVQDREARPGFLDFLAFSIINLLRVVDFLDLARSSHFIEISFVRQGKWPVGVLLTGFKSFFTLVLVQQIASAIREQRLMGEIIAGFWSPHAAIHDSSRAALAQFGALAIGPMMGSLRKLDALTKEQRDELPRVFADLGPTAIPPLLPYLADENPLVRTTAALSLGRLQAVEAVNALADMARDPAETVRACAVESLGMIAEGRAAASGQPIVLPARVRRRLVARILNAGGRASTVALDTVWKAARKALHRDLAEQPSSAITTDPLALSVEVLGEALADSSPLVRAQAVFYLGRIGPRAAMVNSSLIAIMQTGTDAERAAAAEGLGRLQAEPDITVPALADTTRDTAAAVRKAACESLGRFGADAAPAAAALIALLDDADEQVRDAATAAINQIGALTPEATQALEEKLTHPDNMMRAQTAEALGEMGEAAEAAAPALVESLADENDLVRSKAAEALGKIGETAAEVAVPALVSALNDPDNTVKAQAAEALGQMGPAAGIAIPQLMTVLESENAEVRRRVVEAVGQIGEPAVRSRLEEVCADEDPSVRAAAVRALGKLGTSAENTVNVLLQAAADESAVVRAEAAEAVARCIREHPRLAATLSALIDDGSAEVALRMIRELPRFGPGIMPAVLDILARQLSEESNSEIASAAAEAIGRFGASAAAVGPALAKAAQVGAAEVRRAAIKALTLMTPAEASAAFLAGLRDADLDVRRQSSAALMRVSKLEVTAVPELIEALADPDDLTKANVAAALLKLETLPPVLEPVLVELTTSTSLRVRRQVARALGRIDSVVSRETLSALRQDPDERVRKAADVSLKTLADKSATAEEQGAQAAETAAAAPA